VAHTKLSPSGSDSLLAQTRPSRRLQQMSRTAAHSFAPLAHMPPSHIATLLPFDTARPKLSPCGSVLGFWPKPVPHLAFSNAPRCHHHHFICPASRHQFALPFYMVRPKPSPHGSAFVLCVLYPKTLPPHTLKNRYPNQHHQHQKPTPHRCNIVPCT
jgi:hypothetical protein